MKVLIAIIITIVVVVVVLWGYGKARTVRDLMGPDVCGAGSRGRA